MTKELPRLTFEDVLRSQIALAEKIEQLIKEKRTLNEDERIEFRRIYRRATMGLGARVAPRTGLPGLKDKTLDGIVINYLSTPKSKGILIGWAGTDDRGIVPPAKAWKLVLERLNEDVFGFALERALQLSPERERYEPTRAERFY